MDRRAQREQRGGVVARRELDLIRRCLEGDVRILQDLMAHLKVVPRTLAYRNRKLGSPLNSSELEDLAQDVLGSIWLKLEHYSGRGSFDAWVYRFCVLALLSRLRKLRRLPIPFADASKGIGDPQARQDPDRLEYEHVYEGLSRLDEREGEIIRLKHLEDYTFEEISRSLEMSRNTVKSRYYRGMIKLRRLLGESARTSEERR